MKLPVEQAGKYKDYGFKNLHVVDLDGALIGKTVNIDIVQDIVSKFNLKVEVGGGLEILMVFKNMLMLVLIILGSAAIKDEIFKEACEKFPNKITLV